MAKYHSLEQLEVQLAKAQKAAHYGGLIAKQQVSVLEIEIAQRKKIEAMYGEVDPDQIEIFERQVDQLLTMPTQDSQCFYAFELHCTQELYVKYRNVFQFFLAETEDEKAITSWASRASDNGVKLFASIEKQEAKTLHIRAESSIVWGLASYPYQMPDIMPYDKKGEPVKESFVPVHVAVDIDGLPYLPSHGYIYHFINLQCQAEYICDGNENNAWLQRTESHYDELGKFHFHDEISIGHAYVLMLPCTYQGQFVRNQQILFTSTRLTAMDMMHIQSMGVDDYDVFHVDVERLQHIWKKTPAERPLVTKDTYHHSSWGEKLGQIARLYECSIEDLYQLNPDIALRAGQLRVGERVKIAQDQVIDMYQPAKQFVDINLSDDMFFEIEDYQNLPQGFAHYSAKDLFAQLPFLKIATLSDAEQKARKESKIYHLPHPMNNR